MADEDDLPEQLRIRREKRAGILKRGAQAYPVSVPRTTSLLAIRQKHKDLAIDVSTGIIESVTGRVIFKRDTGKLCFANLREGDGTELQVNNNKTATTTTKTTTKTTITTTTTTTIT
jgi:lysyl-tRNA synthetase class 2